MGKSKKSKLSISESMALIEEKKYKEAAETLDKVALGKASRAQVTELLFLMVPHRSRHAKEFTQKIIMYGKWNLYQRNGEGNALIIDLVKNHRIDVLHKILPKAKKFKKNNPEQCVQWTYVLQQLLNWNQNGLIHILLKKQVLKCINETDKADIYHKLIRYKDEAFFKAIRKQEKAVSQDYLISPETVSEEYFIRMILEKYTRSIGIKDNRSRLWEICLACGAEKMIWRMLKQKKDYQYIETMVGGSDEVFNQVLKLKPEKISDNLKKQVLLAAFMSETGKQRLEDLKERGWNKSQIKGQTIHLLEDYKNVIVFKRYEKNKRGNIERTNDQSKLRYLESCEA